MEARKFRVTTLLMLNLGLLMLMAAVPPTLAAWRTPQASFDVVVNEIAWMGTTTAYNDEWIELYNNTGSPVDLTGWTLNAVDSTPAIRKQTPAMAAGVTDHCLTVIEFIGYPLPQAVV